MVFDAPGVTWFINLIVVVVPSTGRGLFLLVDIRPLCGVVRLSTVSAEASTTKTLNAINSPFKLNIATGFIFLLCTHSAKYTNFREFLINPPKRKSSQESGRWL